MALVQLMPVRRQPGAAIGRPKLLAAPPKNRAKIDVGPIVIELRESGDLMIYTQQTMPVTSRVSECDVTVQRLVASETNRILIKSCDVDALTVALDGALQKR